MFLAIDLLSFSKYINSNSDNREFSAPRKFQKEIINCCLAFSVMPVWLNEQKK